jgi:putative endonuclease
MVLRNGTRPDGPRQYYVYIATNRQGTLYTGMTNDVESRINQHRHGLSAFTSRYRIGKLIYAEVTEDLQAARERERQIKGWTRAKKLALIRTLNPAMRDLSAAGGKWWRLVRKRRVSR